MTTDPRKLTGLVTADLEPGETLLAAVKASPAGQAHQQILSMAGMSQLGVPGAIAGSRLGEPAAEAGATDRAEAGLDTGHAMQVLVGLTGRRLLVWRIGGLRSRPKGLIGSLERSAIARLELGTTSLMGFSQPEITVHTTESGSFGLAVAKIHRGDAEAFVAAASSTAGQ